MANTSSSTAAKSSKGLLQGLTPDQAHLAGTELYKQELTLEDLFGDDVPTGSLSSLLDQVLALYGDGHIDVPWFTKGENGKLVRTIVRSPLSRELQLSTVESYKNRILAESISQVAAGTLHFSGFQLSVTMSVYTHRYL